MQLLYYDGIYCLRMQCGLFLLLILLLREPLLTLSPNLRHPSSSYSSFNGLDLTAVPLPILVDTNSNNTSSMSKSRVYTDINVVRPREYWDYESFALHWGYSLLFHSFDFSLEHNPFICISVCVCVKNIIFSCLLIVYK